MLKLEDTKEIFAFVAWLDRCFYSRASFEKNISEIIEETKPHLDKIDKIGIIMTFGRYYQEMGSITKLFQAYALGPDALGSRDYEDVFFTYVDRMLTKWNSYSSNQPYKS